MSTVQPAQQLHILIIDDNQEILDTLEIILQRKHFRVSTKTILDDIQETVRDILPDLILLDKSLGWADGCDLCQQLKANTELANIPVIMFSAYFKKQAACLAAGANKFVEKPFATQTLLDAIAGCLVESI